MRRSSAVLLLLALAGVSFAAEGEFAFTGNEYSGALAAMYVVLGVAAGIIVALVGVRLLRTGAGAVAVEDDSWMFYSDGNGGEAEFTEVDEFGDITYWRDGRIVGTG